jgi:biotin synthase
MNNDIRNNWSIAEIKSIYNTPLLELIFSAAQLHRKYNDTAEVQVCTLLSIKTGVVVKIVHIVLSSKIYNRRKCASFNEKEEVLEYAQKAKDAGSTRFCMGAAWREVRDNKDFDRVLDMVKGVNKMGMEVCCTLGMLTEEQAHNY